MCNNDSYYCMTPAVSLAAILPEQAFAPKGAVLSGKRWTDRQIKVAFLEGSPALQEKVLAVAKTWEKYANIEFVLSNSEDSDIRVAFQTGMGSWSYLGTDSLSIAKDAPTMNYGWLDDNSTQAVIRRVVLHEFGHAIGFVHEQQNPTEPIRWNKAAVYADLSKPPNNWDPATIENNMFRKYDDVIASAVDSKSIMMYPIPKSWTENGYFSAGFNSELSEQDKEIAQRAYPS